MVGLEKLLIGRTIGGRYAVEELIGQGRGGLVYRARDSQAAGAEVAVKVLNAPRSAEARERFRQLVGREVRAASGIRHPNVAAMLELGSDAELDLDFVAMELMRGQSLAGVLAQRGKPPISLGLRLLADAAEGLAAGHAAGLVHRDLRPASLYLVRTEAERHVRVKLTGFGMPQLVRRESLLAAAPELRAYASPEMLANGSARLTPASDVFSLGMIGFELMTGALPLDEAARRALADGGRVEIEPPLELAAAVPPHVMDAVLQALRMDPAERFADGTAFAAAVRQPSAPEQVFVAKIVGAPEPAAESPAPAVFAAPEPQPAPSAEVPSEPVVDATPVAEAEPAAAEPSAAAVAAVLAAAGALAAEAAAGEPAAAEAVIAEPPVAESTPAESLAPVAEAPSAPAPAEPSAPAAPVATPAKSGRSRAAAPKTPESDLPLYYPPQLAKTPAAEPKSATPAPKSVVQPSAPKAEEKQEEPAPAVAPIAAAAPVAVTPPAPVVETPPAPAPVAESAPADEAAPASAPAAGIAPVSFSERAERRRKMAAAGGFRAPPAMAAGFVLGLLVLGSAAWVATRHGGRQEAAANPTTLAANQLAAGAALPNAATAAQPAAPSQAAAPTTTAPAADSAAKAPTAEQQAALDAAKKKQQDDERRRQDEEKARQAALLQQQTQKTAQAQPQQPAAQPAPQQAAPAPARQQVAAAPPPPPAPAPAPAREDAAPARASNEVYDEDVVEERPQLTNASELQRALQTRYPPQLAANRVSGRVTATFVVGPDGHVDGSSIRILNTPNPGFNGPTQNVLRRARFRPATVKGQAVRVQVTMPITWSLAQ